MQQYLNQLLEDIARAGEDISWPFTAGELNIWDWIPDEEEDKTAPVRNLEDWTGIRAEMLPPQQLLTDEQVGTLLAALNKMLDAYNCSFVMQLAVPERVQYETIRVHFNQDVKVKRWHMGFFEICRPGTKHGTCSLGEYCHCAFFAEFFKDMIDEDPDPEEERTRMLETEIRHLQRRHGDDWMKYYPYHLDKNYDDENGNPYDYGFGESGEEEDDEDNWWRK